MARPDSGSGIVALRANLQGPYPELRELTVTLIRGALQEPTFGAAAKRLHVERRALERLREAFPEVFLDAAVELPEDADGS